MRNRIIGALLLALGVGGTATAQQGVVPTMGKEFWVGYMQNYGGGGNQHIDLFISSYVNTTGTVEMPLLGFTQNFVVAANTVTTVTLPITAVHQGSEVVDNKSFLVRTADTVAVYALNFEDATADAASVLPINSLGTQYRVHCYYGLNGLSGLSSEFLIVATKDGTQVEITPTAATAGGRPAGVPFLVDLDSAETYQVQAANTTDDLSGTTIVGTAISGSCRPFAVFSGSVCTNIPVGCFACDHVFEQNLPTNVWGTKFFTVPWQGPNSYTYRVMANTNGTGFTLDGVAQPTLNAGQFDEVNYATQAHCIESAVPISVSQYIQGQDCSGNVGDPALLILNAEEQKISNISFATVVSPNINNQYIAVVVETAASGTVVLDGTTMPAASFTPYTACPTHSHATFPLTQGSHSIACPSGLIGYVYGVGNNYETYAYSVGAFTPIPPLVVDSVLCGVDSSGTLTLSPPQPINNPWWSTVTNPTDTLFQGLTYTFIPPGSDVYVVTGSEFISSCEQQYFFSVEVDDPPTLTVTANGTAAPTVIQVCAYSPVQLNVIPNPPGQYLYNWWPDPLLSDGSIPNPIATPTTSGWFYVSVSTLNGCAVAVDSIYIDVFPGDVLIHEATTTDDALCLGDTAQLDIDIQQIVAQDVLDNGFGTMWNNLSGGVIGNQCGSVSGNTVWFDGAGPRFVETIPLNVVTGGTIQFALHIGAGAAPCEDADPGEDVVLEYSTGGPWVPITTLQEALYPNWTTVSIPIPAGAQTAATAFRWIQNVSTGPGEDNWALDNVAIAVIDPSNLLFSWSPSVSLTDAAIQNPIAQPTTSGYYYITSTDLLTGCSYTDSVFIDVGQPFTIAVTNDTVLCDVAGVQLNATPSSGTGHVWSWTPATGLSATFIEDPIATPLVTTEYFVEVSTAQGCSATDSVTVTVGQVLALTVTTTDDDLCAGETTQLNANVPGSPPNLTYSWAPSASLNNATITNPIATPPSTTNYICTVTDTLSGCLLIDSVLINVTSLYQVVATNDTVLCDPLGFQLNAVHNVPGPVITWTPAAYVSNPAIATPTITFDSTATYIVQVTDPVLGCSAKDTVVVTVPFSDLVFIADSSLCAGDSMLIDAGFPSASHDWSTGETTQTIWVNSAGNYTVTMIDTNGCQVTATTTVTVDPLPVVLLGADSSLCVGQQWTLDAGNPGSTYLWSTGAGTQTITVTTDDQYWVRVTDVNDCVQSDSIDLVFDPLPVIDLNDTTVCVSETITLDAGNPGSTYLWNTNATTQTISIAASTGTYSVVVTTPTWCVDSSDAVITFVDFPVVDLGPDTALCETQVLTLDAGNPGSNYTWSDGSNFPTLSITDDALVWVDVFNGYCTTRDSLEAVFNPLPLYIDVGKVVTCLDVPPNKIVLDAGNPGCTFVWNTGATTQQIEVSTYGLYSVSITTPLNCTITDSVYVEEYCQPAFYMPNVFTPDGDGVNDLFGPDGYNIASLELNVFNRWGELIFTGKDATAFWDGNMNGEPVQDGVYVWKCKYRFVENVDGFVGAEREAVGHVTVLR
ncbi:MAG: gliding motility-associated C-terminal domain-containing protein [Flavobacteriales bacterium]|nr:gliding motility-associated C-terminal domain-containing protein [Flavobacteriales bacterium]